MLVDIAITCGVILVGMLVTLFAIIGFAELIIKWFEKDGK
jgi:hypothetical protein